jgi:hypothetical protein
VDAHPHLERPSRKIQKRYGIGHRQGGTYSSLCIVPNARYPK